MRPLPAPLLHRVRLASDEVRPLFERLMWDVELMLVYGRVRADLSAYNVLYWEEAAKIIDFPQAIDPFRNPSAFFLLHRERV